MSNTPQIPLPLDITQEDLAPYLSGKCNRTAVETVRSWPNWPGPLVYVHGEAACGKTHLARLWAYEIDGMVVDAARLGFAWAAILPDVRCIAIDGLEALKNEEALFHLTNELTGRGGSLLLTAREAPASLSLRLPDLKTRILSSTVVEIGAPDGPFLEQLLLHLAERVQLAMDPAIATYCVSRMERNWQCAVNLIAALDRRSLAEGKAVKRDMATAALDELGQS